MEKDELVLMIEHDCLSLHMCLLTQVAKVWYSPRQHHMAACTSRLEVDALCISRCYAFDVRVVQ